MRDRRRVSRYGYRVPKRPSSIGNGASSPRLKTNSSSRNFVSRRSRPNSPRSRQSICGLSAVGNSELDDINARIAEARAAARPDDEAAGEAAFRARQAADDTASQAGDLSPLEPNRRFDPPPALKTLYRAMARKSHPDLASTDDERVRRNQWMAKANDAYQRQDEDALRALLADWETSPECVSGTGVASDLVRVIRQIAHVRHRVGSIGREIEAIEASELYILYTKYKAELRAGRNLLDDLAATLNAQIADAKRELAVAMREPP